MSTAQIGEAYIALRYRVDQLEKDLAGARRKVQQDAAAIGQEIDKGVGEAGGRGIDGLNSKLDDLSGKFNALRGLAVVTFAGAALATVKGFADQVAQAGSQTQLLTARLNGVLGTERGFELATESANKLGVRVKDVADTMARFGMAGKDIGLTTAEVQKLTETVIQLGRISGASGEEASAAMFQLSQALASGRLSGDELRSVLEQMPELARVLASELGVPVGKLREMGAEGELTAEKVATALLGASDKVAARFADLPETLEQSQARWENAWTALLASLDQKFMVSDLYKNVTSFFAGLAEQAAVGLGGGTSQQQISVLEEQLRLQKAIAQGSSAMDPTTGPARARVAELERELAERRRQSAVSNRESGGGVDPVRETGPTVGMSPKGYQKLLELERASEVARAMGMAENVKREQELIGEIRQRQVQAEQRATRELETEQRKREQAQQRAVNEAEKLQRKEIADAEKAEREKKKIDDDAFKRIKERAEAEYEAMQTAADMRREQQMAELERQNKEQREREGEAGYYQRTGDAELAPLYDWKTGLQKSLKDYVDESQQYGRLAGEGLRAGLDYATEGLALLVTDTENAGERISQLVEGMLQDLAKAAIRQALVMGINAATGTGGTGGEGGGGGFLAGLFGGGGTTAAAKGAVISDRRIVPMAKGGIVRTATTVPLAHGAALIGEAGDEGVLPLDRTSSGELGVKAIGGGGGGDVHIHNHANAEVEVEKRPNSRGGEDTYVTLRKTNGSMVENGDLDGPMFRRFGIKPTLGRG